VRSSGVLVADAFRVTRRRRLYIDAVQHLVEQQAIDAAFFASCEQQENPPCAGSR
jgi:hypothetical protein